MSTLTRYVSAPVATIMRQAGIDLEKVDHALTRQSQLYGSTVLRGNHPYVRALTASSGLRIVWISRRHRYVLVQIEQIVAGKFRWMYREFSRNNCEFASQGRIADTLKAALHKAPLSQLIDVPEPLGSVTVDAVADDDDGWTRAKVTPQWQSF
jgi:hypothetical protein